MTVASSDKKTNLTKFRNDFSILNPYWQVMEKSPRKYPGHNRITEKVPNPGIVKYNFRQNDLFWMSFPVKRSNS